MKRPHNHSHPCVEGCCGDLGKLEVENDKLMCAMQFNARICSEKIDKLEEENDELRIALDNVAELWFDGKKDEYACSTCDMGGAGEKTNEDGHDYNCVISGAYLLLQRLSNESKKG